MVKLKDLQPVRELPQKLIQTPTFLNGDSPKQLADLFFPQYEQLSQKHDSFRLRRTGDSNPLVTGLVNKVFADNGNKFRTPTPTDDIYQTIFPMIKDKFYTDLNAFDVWDWTEESYELNKQIWEQLLDLAKTDGVTKFPFRIQGFYCTPDDSEPTYQVRIEPANNFKVIQSDKLNYSGRFSGLDKDGLCIPSEKGFTKYTLGNAVSGVFLGSGGDLGYDNYHLAGSIDFGRVIAIDAEGVGKK